MSQEGEGNVVSDSDTRRTQQLNRVAHSLTVRSSENFHRCRVYGQTERFK
ncbi:hypothetical protein JNB_12838 [Janibacter sp. HTCC2649]|nr:hypothetical protein JNB_12838 [Janibacter sp. HTCC2649]